MLINSMVKNLSIFQHRKKKKEQNGKTSVAASSPSSLASMRSVPKCGLVYTQLQ